MSKKPSKIAESASSYAAKKPAKAKPAPKPSAGGVRYMDDTAFKKASEKVFRVHQELFRKLAQ